MRVAVSGSNGLVGTALGKRLVERGDSVVPLVRRDPKPGEILWDPVSGRVDGEGLASVDAVVHLAGESVASMRWSASKKKRIRDSRVVGTQLLAGAIRELESPPATFICASAIGYYGDRGDEVLNESSSPGRGFLADVAQEWEQAAAAVEEVGTRLAYLRIGVVMSLEGGALPQMLPPFRLGVAGHLGNGQQYFSWIHLDDVVGGLLHLLDNSSCVGPHNGTAPDPVTNREFTRTLAKVLRRPAVIPAPAWVLKTLFGDTAREMLLASIRAVPDQLLQSGYEFQHPKLEPALRSLLESPARSKT